MFTLLVVSGALAVETPSRPALSSAEVAAVRDIEQDTDGWLWLATAAGVFRWDGEHAERQGAPGSRAQFEEVIPPDGTGPAIARTRWGDIVELGPGTSTTLPPPGGQPARDVLRDSTGRLWAVTHQGMYLRGPAGWERRREMDAYNLAEAGGRLWVGGRTTLWECDPSGAVLREWPVAWAAHVVEYDHEIWVQTRNARLVRLADPTPRVVAAPFAIGLGLWVVRGELWTVDNHAITRFARGRQLGPRRELEDDAILLAALRDREGAVWYGNDLGLYQVPSPETELWTLEDGLPESVVGGVASAGSRVWLVTWLGAVGVDPNDVRPIAGPDYLWTFCRDGDTLYAAWADRERNPDVGLRPLGDALGEPVVIGKVGNLVGCESSSSGGIWAYTEDRLFLVQDRAVTGAWPLPHGGFFTALETPEGVLWTFPDGKACQARLPLPQAPSWSCTALPDGMAVRAAIQYDGEVWIGGEGGGILRLDGARWARVEDPRLTDHVSAFATSPRGGVWVTSHTTAPERLRMKGGRLVSLERLDPWTGMLAPYAPRIEEQPDGSLWAGALHIGAEARERPPAPPAPTLAERSVDGVPGEEAVWRRSMVDVGFRVASYRDRGRLRWRYRLSPDEPWTTPGASSTFHFSADRPGTWTVQAQVSLDGERWSPPSEPVGIDVILPWYLRPSTLLGALGLAVGGVGAVITLRRRAQERVDAERRRIARDLHDEIGSNLGALSVLTELAAIPSLEEGERQELAARASDTARATGDALTGIVWALREDASTPEALASAIRMRTDNLFADGSVEVEYSFPDRWPERHFRADELRTVLLVATESLQNVRRHSRARRVRVAMWPWVLEVVDDGVGLGGSTEVGTSTGLASMRERAARIGARLDVYSRPGAGVRVTLELGPG